MFFTILMMGCSINNAFAEQTKNNVSCMISEVEKIGLMLEVQHLKLENELLKMQIQIMALKQGGTIVSMPSQKNNKIIINDYPADSKIINYSVMSKKNLDEQKTEEEAKAKAEEIQKKANENARMTARAYAASRA